MNNTGSRFRWIAAALILLPLFAACLGSDVEGAGDGTTTATDAPAAAATSRQAKRTATATATMDAATPVATPSPTPAPTVQEQPGDAWDERVLSLTPSRPDDVNLFTSDYLENPAYPEAYPEGEPMAPAGGPARSPEEIREALTTFIDGRYSQVEINETLAIFDDPDVAAQIPDANIRAGFALLNLTVARPLVGFFLSSGTFVGELDWEPMGAAFTEAAMATGDGRTTVALNDRYRYEHFALLTANIAQTLLHHDGEATFSWSENVITLFISSYTHAQLLSKHPELAYLDTELARLMNTFVLALVNAHPAGSPHIAQIVPHGSGVLPGSPLDAPDFWTLFEGQDDRSTGPSPLRSILDLMLDDSAVIPANAGYSRDTARLIDEHLDESVLTRRDRVRLLVLLGVISPAEIAALVDADEQDVIDRYGLGEALELRAAR